ncbi:hypothetical protein WOSG25_051190 [Weissella oryzae SG25]|uniref:Glycosyltransferase n=1 Tax=Weissella oryzae (strain DSM 25784 / JCM 18191 / LMG 30913 / SG25) TaxID=1329250 RepID=A0A069CTZ9_WEIOS|nr:hypothetical protein [Weissella oryzae]GAK30847.1 hypothetical protein WOSG25_051190 [Weissella oryzae SG25]
MDKNRLHMKKMALIFGILGIGICLRCFLFSSVPQGITTDEAMTGYNAWTLANYKIDMWGHHFPWYLAAWGSGMNALYEYLAIPFIKIFSLNIFFERLPNLIAGTALLPLFFLFLKKIYSEKVAWIGLILITFNPWAISIARQGLESNLLPAIILSAMVLFAYKKYILAALFFALAIYAYSTILLVLPFMLAALYLTEILKGNLSIPRATYAAFVFLLVALPMILWFLVNLFGLAPFDFGFFSVEKFSMIRQTFGGDLGTNLRVVVTQFDGYLQNGTVESSIGYVVSLPLALIGFIRSIKQKKYLPVIWLLSAIPLIIAVSGNVNRYNVIWLVMLAFVAIGVDYVFEFALKESGFAKKVGIVFISSILALPNVIFIYKYFTTFNNEPSVSATFNQGFDKALTYAKKVQGFKGKVDIIEPRNQRYSLILFYDQIPPQEFLRTVKIVEGQFEFIQIKSFTNYNFSKQANYADKKPMIMPKYLKKSVPSNKTVKEFGQYIVVTEK